MPCYRTARFLEATIARIPWKELPPLRYRLLCVDNASPDDTWEVIQRAVGTLREQGHDVDAIRNPRNLNYGGSVKVAFRYCTANNFGLMIVLHSDGQYAPELLPWLISEFVVGDDALLFGSRLAGDALAGGMPAYKYYANHALTWLQNAALGTRFSELHSGLRLYRVNRVVRLPYEANTDFFNFDNHITFQILKAGWTVGERPIPTYYGEEKSYVHLFRTPLGLVTNVLLYMAHNLGFVRIPRYDIDPRQHGLAPRGQSARP
jgi:glycosyltransferase involved in cell wall biosynthesis